MSPPHAKYCAILPVNSRAQACFDPTKYDAAAPKASSAENQGDQMILMTKAAGLFCTIVALAVLSTGSFAADAAKEVAALRAADQDWAKAYNAGNADGVASLYDEHAVLLPPGTP